MSKLSFATPKHPSAPRETAFHPLIVLGRAACALVLIALLLPVLGAYLGALHPLGDSLAVFRNWLAGLLLVFCLCLALIGLWRRWSLGLALLAAFSFLTATPVPLGLTPADFTQPVTLYQKNLLITLSDPQPILEDILAADPGVITLQEVSQRSAAELYQALPERYSRHICGDGRRASVAVLAAYPVVEGSAFCEQSFGSIAGFQVRTPSGPLWIISVHLHWPYPFDQVAHTDALIPLIEGLEGPVLIGGDFNMVPWSHTLRRFERAADGYVPHPLAGTMRFLDGWFAPPIDHAILPNAAPGGGLIERRPRLGSDHFGLLAVFEGAALGDAAR